MNLDLPWTPLYTQSPAAAAAARQQAGEEHASSSPFTLFALAGTVAFTALVYAFESHLDGRQRKSYQQTTFPLELETVVSAIDAERAAVTAATTTTTETNKKDPAVAAQKSKTTEDAAAAAQESKDDDTSATKPLLPQLHAKFDKSQAYGLDKIQFGMLASCYDTTESIAFLLLGFFPYCWDVAAQCGKDWFNWAEADHEIKISLLFLLLVTLVGTVTSLPFELYSTFQIERKHGFNKQTIGLFVTDKIKNLLLTIVIGGPFTALLLSIIQWGGDYFYLYVWGFMFVFSVFMMTIVPVFIMPLFNKYEPLPDGELKTRIYELAEQLHYPLQKLFVMDGSKRSSHSNAFMFGFGKNKRIVLFDTLLEQVHTDEVVGILGHELGHWKLGHTLTNFVVTQVYFGAAFYAFSLTYGSDDLYAAFGFNDPSRIKPTIIALLLFFQTLWAPVDKILTFLLTIFSRTNEFAADRFSVELGMSQKLQSGLCKIHLENLGAMCPDPWYSVRCPCQSKAFCTFEISHALFIVAF